MYARNAASPERIAIGAVVLIADGTVQTSGVSVKVMPQGGTASAGGGTIAYEEGICHYLPTQAETAYTSFMLIAYKTGCIPVATTVVTTASATAGTVLLAPVTHTSAVVPTVSTLTGHTAQTGDAYARLGMPAGASVSADVAAVKSETLIVKSKTDLIPAAPASTTNITAATGVVLAAATHTGAVIPTVTTLTGHTAQTGDAFARLGAPAGASAAADVAAVKAETAAIKAKTDSMTFTVAGAVDANVQRINDVVITGNGGTGTEFGVT